MKVSKMSFRVRIFLSMILLLLLASILILGVTIYQYDEQTQDYNVQRFGRKEESTLRSIEIELKRTSYPVNTQNLPLIFQERIYEISSIHSLHISMYSLGGKLLKSSIENAFEPTDKTPLDSQILSELANNSNHKILKVKTEDDISYQSSYSYLMDAKFKRIGIVQLQFSQDNSEVEYELNEFLMRLGIVYAFMF